MSTLKLAGVRVEGLKFKMDNDGVFTYKVEMSCRYTDELAKQMGWIPEGQETYMPAARQTGGSFDNTLSASNIIITPVKEELRAAHEQNIAVLSVSKFKYKHDIDEDVPKNRRVEFEVKSVAEDLHIPLVAFMKIMNAGNLYSNCKITYVDPENPKDNPQQSIPGTEPEKKRGRAAATEVN